VFLVRLGTLSDDFHSLNFTKGTVFDWKYCIYDFFSPKKHMLDDAIAQNITFVGISQSWFPSIDEVEEDTYIGKSLIHN
jgi:hypothetical protein